MPTKKILVADDDENILSSLRDILELQGYEVALARDGVEAMELMKSFVPDLLLLDLMMPEMDGASVAFDLGRKFDGARTPVVIISGMIQKDAERPAAVRDGLRYLSKPFDVNELLSLVQELLKE